LWYNILEMTPEPPSPPEATTSAVERAIAFGVDITLLIENLGLTPTERLRRGERILKSLVAFKAEVERARGLQRNEL
ncbi:MAG: hypothetical protein HY260_15890, partial [Chloroflexi bacterium]|nr:hypothetical protein [Chloroflexota bacterium]